MFTPLASWPNFVIMPLGFSNGSVPIATVRRAKSGSMSDGEADVLAVATTGPVVQLVGTWFPPFNGVPGYAIAQSWDLSAEVAEGAVIVGLAVTPVPGTPWTGTIAGADKDPALCDYGCAVHIASIAFVGVK